MRWRFDPHSFVGAAALFLVLALLATVGARWGWVRSFLGDVLAVAWVYLLFKAFVGARVLPLALAAFAVGLLVELGQYLAAAWQWQIPNRALRIVLGATADGWDVLAYAIGFVAVLAAEQAFRAVRPRTSAP
ncbi:hypothetical protein M2165_002708 [Variovorax sp. TBS-050B]|nr:hypothetical protein [Variovorax sp. TBS-050B]